MKRVQATRVIMLLITAVFIWQFVDKRKDLQCYVMQLASRHAFVFKAGYASAQEIRQAVWNDTLAAFHGQVWRAKLDRMWHEGIMGGGRGDQVLALLRNPEDTPTGIFCFGSINWKIWHDTASTVFREYSGEDMKTLHQITTALQAIPPDELRHYEVTATVTYYESEWRDGLTAWSGVLRQAGAVSARQWLDGKIAPDYWSGWYADWQELWQALQADDDNDDNDDDEDDEK